MDNKNCFILKIRTKDDGNINVGFYNPDTFFNIMIIYSEGSYLFSEN
jgi:hypothetical protein